MGTCARIINFVVLGWISSCLASPTQFAAEFEVPEVEGCDYLNAYYVNCRWKKKDGDPSTYRLGYLSAADSLEERREKFCEVTQQTRHNGVIIESCGIHGSMYGRFTVFVSRVKNCADDSCTILEKSGERSFTCTSNNVKLTLPPASLEIDPSSKRLNWRPPERQNSMLSFVMHKRKVLYRVEHREIMEEDKEAKWKEWYTGYKTKVYLPTLIPGATYEVRVFASLDAPSSRFSVTSSPQAYQREWTPPSNVLVFLVPQVVPDQAFKRMEENEVLPEEQTTTIGPIRPIHVSRRVIIASAVSTFVVVVVMAVAGYFFPWKRWCCCLNDVSNAKPKIMLDIKEIFDSEKSPRTIGEEKDTVPHERFQPITQIISSISETSKKPFTTKENRTKYLTLHSESGSDFGRQRSLSPIHKREMVDSVSLDNLADHKENKSDEAIASANQNSIWEMTQSKEELRTLLSNCGALSEEEPVRYTKFRQNSNPDVTSSTEMPGYLLTSDQDKTMDSSFDRISGDYVIDDTGIESMLTTNVSSLSEEEEEKNKQWQKHMMETEEDSFSNDVPDYVMHAPILPKDFCRDMSMFVSMATEDVTMRRPLNVYEVAKSPIPGLTKTNEEAGHVGGGSSRYIVMTVCPSCKSSRENECCKSKENNAEEFLALPLSINRRDSVSDNSVDSGYSPDSSDKVELLSSMYVRREGVQNADDTDNEEYMTYVTT